MSRFGEGDGEEYPGQYNLFWANVDRALKGRRGQAALRDMRDALLNLPEKRLIEGALCTVGLTEKAAAMPDTIPWGNDTTMNNYEKAGLLQMVEDNHGEGVCAVGAAIWWKKVKAGMDPSAAFAEIPIGEGEYDTVDQGKFELNISYTLAWALAYRNDEELEGLSPEERFNQYLRWVETRIIEPDPSTAGAARP